MLTIYPTDTVWGLGAPVHSQEENRRVRSIKGNSSNKPLSVLFYNLEHLREFIILPSGWDDSERLNAFFEWEGTLAIPRGCLKAYWGEWIYGESDFATIRCLPLKFLQREECPFTTTSLNLQGESPITDIDEARNFSAGLKTPHRLITDEIYKPSGMASTILAVLPGGETKIWRQGQFSQDIQRMFKR